MQPHRQRPAIAALAGGLLCITLLTQTALAKPNCARPDKAKPQVIATMEHMFAAARVDDLAGFNSIAAPDFYAYDGGRIFKGPALMLYIQQAHAAGKVFEWNVTQPLVHVSCDSAWITYLNKGSVQDSSGRQEVTWLESAMLDYANGEWRIRFFHSTRAPAAP